MPSKRKKGKKSKKRKIKTAVSPLNQKPQNFAFCHSDQKTAQIAFSGKISRGLGNGLSTTGSLLNEKWSHQPPNFNHSFLAAMKTFVFGNFFQAKSISLQLLGIMRRIITFVIFLKYFFHHNLSPSKSGYFFVWIKYLYQVWGFLFQVEKWMLATFLLKTENCGAKNCWELFI